MKHRYVIKDGRDQGFGAFDLIDRALPKELAWIETFKTRELAEAELADRIKSDALWELSHGHGDDV